MNGFYLESIKVIEGGYTVKYSTSIEGVETKVQYPYSRKSGLNGEPSRDLVKALQVFLPYAIASQKLDKDWWLKNGVVTGVNLKYGDVDLVSIELEAWTEETKSVSLKTAMMPVLGLMAMVQVDFPATLSVQSAIGALSQESEMYVNGKRKTEQLELPIDNVVKLGVG